MTTHPAYLDYPWELYDLDYEGFEADIHLYRSLLREGNYRILELASGTGRILIPLARDGHHVCGLELVDGMLQVTRAKVAPEAPEVRDRIELVSGDMRSFELNQSFDCVLLPLKTCLHLRTDREYRATLERVRAHLKPGGLFLLDAFRPDSTCFKRFNGKWVRRYDRIRPGTGERVQRSQRVIHDGARRLLRGRHRWEISGPAGAIGDEPRVRALDLIQHYLAPEELRSMLQATGFSVETLWGDYRRSAPDCPVRIDPHYPSWVQSTAFFICRAT